MIRYLAVWIVLCARRIMTIDKEHNPKKRLLISMQRRKVTQRFFNVANVEILPIREEGTGNREDGNTTTLATLKKSLRSSASPRLCVKNTPANLCVENISATAQAILDARALYPDSSIRSQCLRNSVKPTLPTTVPYLPLTDLRPIRLNPKSLRTFSSFTR